MLSTQIKNIIWLFSDKGLRLIVGVFVGILVARYLGPEQFGIFNLAQSLVVIVSPIATLGLESIFIRNYLTKNVERDIVLGTTFCLKIVGGLGVILICLFLSFFLKIDKIILFIVSTIFLFQSFYVIDYFFKSEQKVKLIVIASTISVIFSSILKLFFIYYKLPLSFFAIAVAFESIITSMALVFFYRINFQLNLFRWKFDLTYAKRLISDSWPIMFTGIVITLYMKLDQIMLGSLVGNYAVGIYAVALRLSEVFYFIPMAIATAYFPEIIKWKGLDKVKYNYNLQTLYTSVVWIAISSAIIMTLVGGVIIRNLFGVEYNGAINILKIHLWTGVFVFFGTVWSRWLVVEGLQKYSLYINILSLISNVILNYFFIKAYGADGAALATLVSYSLGHTVFVWFFPAIRSSLKSFFYCFVFKGLQFGKISNIFCK